MTKLVVGILIGAGLFLAGRHGGPQSETFKKQYDLAMSENVQLKRSLAESTERMRNLERSKVTTIRESKDGTKTTRIRDVSRLTSSTSQARIETTEKVEARAMTDKSVEEKTVIHRSAAVGSLLIGVEPFDLAKGFDAGAAFQAPMFGPLWFGAWGLFKHDIKIGFSLGVSL